jgi:SAM-dependent methyltransferase
MCSTVRIASSEEERAAFQRIINTSPEIPIFTMDDRTARDINVIWTSVEKEARYWLGGQNSCVPNMPVDRQEFWGDFARKYESQLLPVLKEFLEKLPQGENKTAIDLGCGNSLAIPLLLKKGWRVIAVDSSDSALKVLIKNNQTAVDSELLTIVKADLEEFTCSEPADLVIAASVLPYTNPSHFRHTWEKIHELVKTGGYFIGSLFRSAPSKNEFKNMQGLRALGAWFLLDRRMVRPLLTEQGYTVDACRYQDKDPEAPEKEPLCIQFIAKKQ